MEKTLKRQIVNAAEAVKKKMRQMRDIESENKQVLEAVFKPMTEPLNLIANSHKETSQKPKHESELADDKDPMVNEDEKDCLLSDDEKTKTEDQFIDSSDNSNDGTNNSNPLFQTVVDGSIDGANTSSWSTSSENLGKVPFGVRREGGKLLLGSSAITLGDRFISVAGRMYATTPGLKQLLLEKEVDFDMITDKDLENYKQMLMNTNAHRRDFDPTKPIKSNKGQKYKEIIKPLFNITPTPAISQVKGKGLPVMKNFMKDVELKYWNDPNELVERLKLLLASQAAGNTGVNNEIISIIEELYENGNITTKTYK